ncbi:hypothetical protein GW17_00004211 [Ensete ventricosum]|uniref:Uncharacterized protein n=1 Tax=Ensete ventricosum TaxID=4639 RepID=A0A444G8F3_ENSVE|nr:hypothetical protein B296_00038232 [Ensete ventricosum]RWW31170.1 hypothetical protein GW17_00004211 [Ensete ventricosum]
MKIYWGDAREKICEAIDSIPLSCLIIGNRGHGGIKRLTSSPFATDVLSKGEPFFMLRLNCRKIVLTASTLFTVSFMND